MSTVPSFSVLDVETTSGDPTNGRVMDLAIIALDGPRERLRWSSLIAPREPVPPFIRRLTGIHPNMLKDAPIFPEVVRTVQTMTQDRIVVAHNVRFDMTALEHEFARTGLVLERRTLCTERLGRRLLPELTHHNLGSMCRYFGIPFSSVHRAESDANATADLLRKLLDHFGAEQVLSGVRQWRSVHHA